MKWSYQIARVFGIPIRVHIVFLILLPIFPLWMGSYPYLFGLLTICLVFFCVVLHELGHCVMAKHFGVVIRDIVLLPIGGVARMESMPERPSHEILIALAGIWFCCG